MRLADDLIMGFELCVWRNLCIMDESGAGFKDQSARQELYLNNKKAPA